MIVVLIGATPSITSCHRPTRDTDYEHYDADRASMCQLLVWQHTERPTQYRPSTSTDAVTSRQVSLALTACMSCAISYRLIQCRNTGTVPLPKYSYNYRHSRGLTHNTASTQRTVVHTELNLMIDHWFSGFWLYGW